MYKLIIVEDEFFVRIGLEHAVNWSIYGVEITGSVSNGVEALECYNNCGADIIVTDIKMPFMDGIQLISEIRKTDRDVKFIILTCMEDFHLAQEAMRYGVSFYLTKHELNPQDLADCVEKICEDLKRENEQKEENAFSISSGKKEYTVLNEYFFETEKGEECEYLSKYKRSNNTYCLMKLCVWDAGANDRSVDIEKIIDTIQHLLLSQKFGEIVAVKNEQVFVLYVAGQVNLERFETNIINSINYLNKMVYSYFNKNSVFFKGTHFNEIENIKQIYEQIQQVDYLPFFIYDEFIFKVPCEYGDKIAEKINADLKKVADVYKNNLGNEYREKYLDFSQVIAETLIAEPDVVKAKDLLIQWHSLFMVLLHMANEKSEYYQIEFSQCIMGAANFHSACTSLYNCMGELLSLIDAGPKIPDELLLATEYIKNHIDEELTLPEVAKHVNFSAGHLSFLFRQQLNTSFTDYVLKRRTDAAKELLKNTNYKLYDVAGRVGFKNPSYFNKAFKRIVGVSPSQYRENNKKGFL